MLHLLFYVDFGLLDSQIYYRPHVTLLAASVTGAIMSWVHRCSKLSGPACELQVILVSELWVVLSSQSAWLGQKSKCFGHNI